MGPSSPPWDPCFGLQIKAVIRLRVSDVCQKAGLGKWDLVGQWIKTALWKGSVCVCPRARVCVYVLHAWICKYVCMCKTAFLARKETPDSSLHPPLPSPCVPSQFTR